MKLYEKKQVIVLDSGKNVYPDELEALYMEIEGVKNVAVFEHIVKGKTVTYGVFSVEPDMTMEKLGEAIAAANNHDIKALTKAINGGLNGFTDRENRTNRLMKEAGLA